MHEKNKSFFAVTAHIGNWEWTAITMDFAIEHKTLAIIKPLNNKEFEKYLVSLRTKYSKNSLIHFKLTIRELLKHKQEQVACIILGDQRPLKHEIEYWTNFMNQDTPVFLGTEKLAKTFNYAVVFMNIQRVKRGYYEVSYSLITDEPNSTNEYSITNSHIAKLEEIIRKNPENWLWSHNRWKIKRDDQ